MIIYDGTKEDEPNNTKVSIGDVIYLSVGDITNSGFKNSDIGEFMLKYNLDALLEIGQRRWGELKFKLFFSKNGETITNKEYWDIVTPEHSDDVEPDDNDLYWEHGNYSFMRYIIKSGIVKINK